MVLIIDQNYNPENVPVLEISQFWLVGKEVIQHSLIEHPEMAQAVDLNLSSMLHMLASKVEQISFHQVTFRLAHVCGRFPVEKCIHLK
jgi:hypothetical protein